MKNWKKQLFTIPNLLSLFRLALIPVYIQIYLNATTPAHYYTAGGILAASCMTDMVDGKIARRFNMITDVGKLLDPLADKLTQLALTVCLSMRYRQLQWVLLLFLIKECFQVFAAWVNFKRGKVLNGALMSGKICTTVLFVSLTVLVIFPHIDPNAVTMIALTDILFMGFTLVRYIFAFFGKYALVQDYEP